MIDRSWKILIAIVLVLENTASCINYEAIVSRGKVLSTVKEIWIEFQKQNLVLFCFPRHLFEKFREIIKMKRLGTKLGIFTFISFQDDSLEFRQKLCSRYFSF